MNKIDVHGQRKWDYLAKTSHRDIIQLANCMYLFPWSPSGFKTERQLVKALILTQLEHTVAQILAKDCQEQLRIKWIQSLMDMAGQERSHYKFRVIAFSCPKSMLHGLNEEKSINNPNLEGHTEIQNRSVCRKGCGHLRMIHHQACTLPSI